MGDGGYYYLLQERLRASQPGVRIVADWLDRTGHQVVDIPETKYRPPNGRVEDYVDKGDIIIARGGERYIVQVKHITRQFTCLDDWPSIFRRVILVDVQSSVERILVLPFPTFWHVTLSQDGRHVAVLDDAKTMTEWYLTQRFDHKIGRMRDFYACAVSLARFYTIA